MEQNRLWVHHPSQPQMLATSRAIACAASEHAAQCWSELVAALELGSPAAAVRHAFDHAVANQAYTWAVYHAVVADAGPTESAGPAD